MPKRTNEFQRLIAFIEHESASVGVKVTESAELEEYEDTPLREIDILIETEVNGHPIKIGIECRDHSRPQPVGWIEELIGKYQHLNVSNVVAVSRSGFTKTALKKAKVFGIQTLTFKEALETDWSQEFIRPYIKFLAHRCNLKAIELTYKSGVCPLLDEQLWDCLIVTKAGIVDGSFKEIVERLFNEDASKGVFEYITNLPKETVDELYEAGEETMEDVNISYAVVDRFLITPDGERYELSMITFHIAVTFDVVNAENKHFFYNQSQVTTGTLELNGSPCNLSMTVVQFPDRSDRFKIASVTLMPKR